MVHKLYDPKQPLNEQQIKFCEEFLIDGKVGAAAFRAGYSFATRGAIGSRLLKDPRVQKYLAKRREKMQTVTGITPERILQELWLIGTADVTDILARNEEDGKLFLDLQALDKQKLKNLGIEFTTDSTGKVILGRVKNTPSEKVAALVQVGKHLGMFTEKVEHSGAISLDQLVIASFKKPEPLEVIDVTPELIEDKTKEEVDVG